MEKKALIVLVVDHDTYASEDGKPLDNEVLLSFGREANNCAAFWLGYEAWIVVPDVPEPLFNALAALNLPLPPTV